MENYGCLIKPQLTNNNVSQIIQSGAEKSGRSL